MAQTFFRSEVNNETRSIALGRWKYKVCAADKTQSYSVKFENTQYRKTRSDEISENKPALVLPHSSMFICLKEWGRKHWFWDEGYRLGLKATF